MSMEEWEKDGAARELEEESAAERKRKKAFREAGHGADGAPSREAPSF